MKISMDDLYNWFVYHKPTVDQTELYQELRKAGLDLAIVILMTTPAGPDQTAAIRKVREAVMTANAAIACYVPPEAKVEADAGEGPEA